MAIEEPASSPSELIANSATIGELVDGAAEDVTGAEGAEAKEEEAGEDEPAQGENNYWSERDCSCGAPLASPVEIRIVRPTHTRTLPHRPDSNVFQTLTLLPQTHETIQELKLAVNEYVGGYWLGPYSLRVPAGEARKVGAAESASKPQDGVADIKEGDKLSDWLEVGHVFDGYAATDKRVLEVHRGELRSSRDRFSNLLSRAIFRVFGPADGFAACRALVFDRYRNFELVDPGALSWCHGL